MAKKKASKQTRPASKAARPASRRRKTRQVRPASRKSRAVSSSRKKSPAKKAGAKKLTTGKTIKKAAKKTLGRKPLVKKVKKVKKAAISRVRRTASARTTTKSKRPALKQKRKKVAPKAKRVAGTKARSVSSSRTSTALKPRPVPVPRADTPPKAAVAVEASARRSPALDRERRTVFEPSAVPGVPSSLVPASHASAANSGAEEMRIKLASYTSSSPELTAGDVDANWEAADTVGDEAPGGDNPTPGQDVVDEIGRALGVEYADNEELQGGDEIAGRDRDRWELDPGSSDDFEDR